MKTLILSLAVATLFATLFAAPSFGSQVSTSSQARMTSEDQPSPMPTPAGDIYQKCSEECKVTSGGGEGGGGDGFKQCVDECVAKGPTP